MSSIPDRPGGYDDASAAHAFMEPCAYCGDLTPGDEMIVDQYDYLRCEACCNDICALCQDERVPYANLCEHCLRWQGVAALAGAFAHGLRIQTRGQTDPILGMLRFIVYHGGCAKLIIFTPDGDEDPDGTLSGWTQWVPASEVVRVEECLELSSPNPERLMHYELRQLLDWMVCEIALVKMEKSLEADTVVDDDEIVFVTSDGDGGGEGATAGDAVSDVPGDTQALLEALGVAEEEADSHPEIPNAEPGEGPNTVPSTRPDDKEKDRHRRRDK